jgi:hypothetical protein
MEICIDPALAKVFREIEVAGHINGVVLKQHALYFNAVNRGAIGGRRGAHHSRQQAPVGTGTVYKVLQAA